MLVVLLLLQHGYTLMSAHTHTAAPKRSPRHPSAMPPLVPTQVTVAGAEADSAVYRSRVHDNTLLATIDETFTTPIHYPETALLLFQLKDKDPRKSDVLGYYGMSVSTLRCGAFVLPLAEPSSGDVHRDHGGRAKKWIAVDLKWVEGADETKGETGG